MTPNCDVGAYALPTYLQGTYEMLFMLDHQSGQSFQAQDPMLLFSARHFPNVINRACITIGGHSC